MKSLFAISLLWTSLAVFGPSASDAFTPLTSSTRRIPTPSPETVLFYTDDAITGDLHPREVLAYQQRQAWIDNSLSYYRKVMREDRRRREGQAIGHETEEYQDDFLVLAKKHYFALRKIKDGKPRHAEAIYRRIIGELVEDEACDHARLAVTTLLLALLLQRVGTPKEARSVFLNFFRVAVLDHDETECACSAKVMQAFALFEMKQGNTRKSLELVRKAIQLDSTLEPVLNWKQFRDVMRLERQ